MNHETFMTKPPLPPSGDTGASIFVDLLLFPRNRQRLVKLTAGLACCVVAQRIAHQFQQLPVSPRIATTVDSKPAAFQSPSTESTLEALFVTNVSSDDLQNSESKSRTAQPPKVLWIPNEPDPEIVRVITEGMSIQYPKENVLSYRPLDNCTITSQVQLLLPTLPSHSKWRLHAVDRHGTLKTIGGDEFYVTLHNVSLNISMYLPSVLTNGTKVLPIPPPTAVATVTDLENGVYELDFVTPPRLWPSNASSTTAVHASVVHTIPLEGVTITVYFILTCGMGQAPQPLKQGWKSGGGTRIGHMVHVPHDWFDSNDAGDPIVAPLALRPFVPPTLRVELPSMTKVILFGDSLVQQLAGYYHRADPPHRRSNVDFRANVRRRLCNSTVQSWLDTLDEWHGPQLRHNESVVALVTGSSAWDVLTKDTIQGLSFRDHLEAVEYFVTTVQERYPRVQLVWKSPSALHLHRAGPDCWGKNVDCIGQLRYMSQARVTHLHREQGRIMHRRRIPVMNVYDGSYLSAHAMLPGDALHYQTHFSEQMLSWFYDGTPTDNLTVDCPGRIFNCQ